MKQCEIGWVRKILLACALVGGVLSGCSDDGSNAAKLTSEIDQVEVIGSFGNVPEITYPDDFKITAPQSKSLWQGESQGIKDGDVIALKIYAKDASTGEMIRDDSEALPVVYQFTQENVGSELYEALLGLPPQSRVLHLSNSEDSSIIMVVDILPTAVSGVENTDQIPGVSVTFDTEPQVSIDQSVPAPTTLTISQKILGRGPQIQSGSQVLIRVKSVKWSDGSVIESNWGPDGIPQPIIVGQDRLVEGLEDALIDIPQGARIVVTVPPELAFQPTENELAQETIVYVIDILAVQSSN